MSLWRRARNRWRRDLSRWCAVRTAYWTATEPVVSFTFDDFPRSALLQGGQILREQGWRGTYYTSFGLMGQDSPSGKIFSAEDLPEFARQQHEWGCHTFDHCHAWETAPAEFEASILRNRLALAERVPGHQMLSHAYPIHCARPEIKTRAARYYAGSRGGGQTFNHGRMDLNSLLAFFIEQSRDDLDAIKRIIDDTLQAQGWLILATHDVDDVPSAFGCSPALFKQIVKYVGRSGALVRPVGVVLQSLAQGAPRLPSDCSATDSGARRAAESVLT